MLQAEKSQSEPEGWICQELLSKGIISEGINTGFRTDMFFIDKSETEVHLIFNFKNLSKTLIGTDGIFAVGYYKL